MESHWVVISSKKNWRLQLPQLYPPVLFRINYYSIEIPHGVTAISLTYHPHHAKLQVTSTLAVLHWSRRRCKVCNFHAIELRSSAELNSIIHARSDRVRSDRVADIRIFAGSWPADTRINFFTIRSGLEYTRYGGDEKCTLHNVARSSVHVNKKYNN